MHTALNCRGIYKPNQMTDFVARWWSFGSARTWSIAKLHVTCRTRRRACGVCLATG